MIWNFWPYAKLWQHIFLKNIFIQKEKGFGQESREISGENWSKFFCWSLSGEERNWLKIRNKVVVLHHICYHLCLSSAAVINFPPIGHNGKLIILCSYTFSYLYFPENYIKFGRGRGFERGITPLRNSLRSTIDNALKMFQKW